MRNRGLSLWLPGPPNNPSRISTTLSHGFIIGGCPCYATVRILLPQDSAILVPNRIVAVPIIYLLFIAKACSPISTERKGRPLSQRV